MIQSTLIFRDDGLPLCASVDEEGGSMLAEEKKRVKLVVSRLTPQSAPEATLTGGNHDIHYLRRDNVVFFAICERGWPRNLAFSYLGDIASEFIHSYGSEYSRPNVQPYAYVGFDMFLGKTRRIYSDKRVQDNLDQLNQELAGVQTIMSKNIEDLLYRGDSLDRISDMSHSLKESSKKYRQSARKINFDLLLSQYAPIAILAFLCVFLLYWLVLRRFL